MLEEAIRKGFTILWLCLRRHLERNWSHLLNSSRDTCSLVFVKNRMNADKQVLSTLQWIFLGSNLANLPGLTIATQKNKYKTGSRINSWKYIFKYITWTQFISI